MHRAGNEDHLIAEVLDSDLPQACDRIERPAVIPPHFGSIHVLASVFLSWLQ